MIGGTSGGFQPRDLEEGWVLQTADRASCLVEVAIYLDHELWRGPLGEVCSVKEGHGKSNLEGLEVRAREFLCGGVAWVRQV